MCRRLSAGSTLRVLHYLFYDDARLCSDALVAERLCEVDDGALARLERFLH